MTNKLGNPVEKNTVCVFFNITTWWCQSQKFFVQNNFFYV